MEKQDYKNMSILKKIGRGIQKVIKIILEPLIDEIHTIIREDNGNIINILLTIIYYLVILLLLIGMIALAIFLIVMGISYLCCL